VVADGDGNGDGDTREDEEEDLNDSYAGKGVVISGRRSIRAASESGQSGVGTEDDPVGPASTSTFHIAVN
jgi:hypothetical protein